MIEPHVTYAKFKEAAQNHGWAVHHVIDGATGRNLYTGIPEHIYPCRIDDEEFAAWQADFPASILQECEGDALITIRGMRGQVTEPVELDGKRTMVVSPAADGWETFFSSFSDDPLPTPPESGRGMGSKIEVKFDGAEAPGTTKSTVLSWNEPVQIHDGALSWNPDDWEHDDLMSFRVVMPATVTTPNAGLGSCNLFNLGGYNLIVPAAGNGSHDIDLAQAVPIPAKAKNGYFDVDRNTGAVTVSADPGKAAFNLLDIQISPHFIRRLSLGDPRGIFEIDSYKASWLSERYEGVLEVYRAGSGTAARINGWLMLFREFTT